MKGTERTAKSSTFWHCIPLLDMYAQ